ncbi:abortive infection system antitoxin AbiGi family protein [Ancylomarina longa]|uniref:Uncharacterized protein n=1 Tax=Ancylomarina longa TaxID=2487017 RepID=A0A434AF93_9BACT|nr:abortive infection system antitoxin AbiGi family protein [Ancylomarina longa]RUT73039.1 hypothetical protein DLK05_15310 [Ancylomarina longa]
MRKTVGYINTQQNLSSDTLFHFTDSLEILDLILSKGLQARFIYEKLPRSRVAYFVKTICFCDIPLGAIKTHLNWYGNFGIGINRAKAKKYGITPVNYIHSNSPQISFSSSLSNRDILQKSKITPHLKQIRGKQMFYDEKKNEYYWKWKKFYEEREWRFFPEDNEISVTTYKKEIELEEKRQSLNLKSSLPNLKMDINDIEYIIIEKQKDIFPLIGFLKRIDSDKKSIEVLLTKVITSHQILKDF